MQSQKSHLTLICTDSTHQKERFEELLGEPSGDFNYKIIIHNLYQGFILPDAGIHLLTDHEIFNRYHRPRIKRKQVRGRSEEHTSELQSRGHLVCRLLLEKKKNTRRYTLKYQ